MGTRKENNTNFFSLLILIFSKINFVSDTDGNRADLPPLSIAEMMRNLETLEHKQNAESEDQWAIGESLMDTLF